MTHERRSLFFVRGEQNGTQENHAALDRRFHQTGKLPPVECPVCGMKDNDWPEREGLCCLCWCAAFQLLTTERPKGDKEPSLVDVQRKIGRIVHDAKEYPAFAEQIRKYRESTGTLRRNPATPEIPATPATPKNRVKRQISEEEREYQKQYRERHRKKINAQKRQWYLEHREVALAAALRWRREHREEWNRYQREYDARCKAKEAENK